MGNQEAVDSLKAMAYFSLGSKSLAGHEIMLEVQCSRVWNIPDHWMELRSLCTIEVVSYILEELIKDGLVETVSGDSNTMLPLERVFYRKRLRQELKDLVSTHPTLLRH